MRRPSLEAARDAGAVTLNAGLFADTVINFLIIAMALFLVIRTVNRLQEEQAPAVQPAPRDCPFCLMTIPIQARRCAHCISGLPASGN